MNFWTSEDISKILIQLDDMKLPFEKYSLSRDDNGLKMLGRGGSAEVYEAENRKNRKANYALKVIGFHNQNTDSDFFNEAVDVQKEIGEFKENVVKIYDHAEVWVTLDGDDSVASAAKKLPENVSGTTIKLQFILMEKISSVFSRTKGGNIKMLPQQLACGNESEILKLAYDVGTALKRAHEKKILHRDVKLENVFYSEKKKQYKLGDFGIAKKTDNGFAETVAFTNGYAAPEVRTSYEKYDNTADIYSFGMMLYVLANGLKFPESNTYNVNSAAQYTRGFVLRNPENKISEKFFNVIAKACSYEPDQRYQSMDEMILDIEKLMYSDSLSYNKEHKNASLAVGSIMLFTGIIAWKLVMAPEVVVRFSVWEYIFLAECFVKGILKIFKKNVAYVSICILGTGIYLMIATGFSLIKLIILLWMVISSGGSSGYIAVGTIIVTIISRIQQVSGTDLVVNTQYNWVVVWTISAALVLLYQYGLMTYDERKIIKLYYRKGFWWIIVCLFYVNCIMLEYLINKTSAIMLLRSICGEAFCDFLTSFDIGMVGIYGLAFSLFWIVRERILIYAQKIHNQSV